jgi:hypothetical protein
MAALNMRSYFKHDASEADQVTTSFVRYELGQLRMHMGDGASGGECLPGGVGGDITFRAQQQDREVYHKSNPSLTDIRKHVV